MIQIQFKKGELEKWQKLSKNPKSPKKKKRKKVKPKAKSQRLHKKASKSIPFKDTELGRYIYVYAPAEYWLLQQCSRGAPSIITLEHLSVHSGNPAFATSRFRRALIDFKHKTANPTTEAIWTIADALEYARGAYITYSLLKQCAE